MFKPRLLSMLCKDVIVNTAPMKMTKDQAKIVKVMCEEGLLDVSHPSVIQAELVIGGVEANPGPRMQLVSFLTLYESVSF